MGDSNSSITPQDLMALIGTDDCPRLFDVRRAVVFADADDMIPSATWRDPTQAETWGAGLAKDREIVVYCVHGHEVSQSAAAALRAMGLSVRYLDGGIEGYRASGGALVPKAPSADGSLQ